MKNVEPADAIEWDVSEWIPGRHQKVPLEQRLRTSPRPEFELAARVVEEVKKFTSGNSWEDGPMSLPRVGGMMGLNDVVRDIVWFEMTGRFQNVRKK